MTKKKPADKKIKKSAHPWRAWNPRPSKDEHGKNYIPHHSTMGLKV